MLHKWAVSTINSIDHNILGKQYVLKAYLAYLKDQCWYFKWRRAWLYDVRPIRHIPRQHNICFRARIARRVIKIPRTHHADITSRHDRAISLYFFSIRNPFWHIFFTFLGGYMQNICLKISEIMLHIAFNTKYKRQFQRVTRFEIMLYFR